VAERPEDALDEDALEASTVIERRKGNENAGLVRLSPLQPLARVNTQSLAAPSPPQLHLVVPEPELPIPDPPVQLLRSGTEPARPLADPRPTGSARRGQGPSAHPGSARAGGRRLMLVGVLSFAAGVLVRDRWQAWRSPPPTVAEVELPPRVVPPPVVVEPPAPPAAAPAPAPPRATGSQKRRRGRGL
jgi:hypothetical protein